MSEQENVEQWAIVEIFGHQVYAGRISEQTMGGSAMLRVDIPAVGDCQAFTKLFGAGAIYAITMTTKETAILHQEQRKSQPYDSYDVRQAMTNEAKRLGNQTEPEDWPL